MSMTKHIERTQISLMLKPTVTSMPFSYSHTNPLHQPGEHDKITNMSKSITFSHFLWYHVQVNCYIWSLCFQISFFVNGCLIAKMSWVWRRSCMWKRLLIWKNFFSPWFISLSCFGLHDVLCTSPPTLSIWTHTKVFPTTKVWQQKMNRNSWNY